MDSILTSTKKLLGIAEDYVHFDIDIITHINSVFSILTQMGIGPVSGFFIVDSSTKWSEYVTSNNIQMVKTYMGLKVRMIFDPPLNNAIVTSYNSQISELEWRLQLEEPTIEEESQNE